MLSQQVAIDTPNGFKVRPVTKYIKTCRSLKSDVTLTCNGKIADSKSPSGLMSLALSNGDIVTISVNGADEEKALQLLVSLMENVGK
jgi:phosphotransferase system HPr (HPr) family protein